MNLLLSAGYTINKTKSTSKLYFAEIETVVCNLEAPCLNKNRPLEGASCHNKIRGLGKNYAVFRFVVNTMTGF